MIWIVTGVMTILSAFLYRLGGMSKAQAMADMPWLPLALVHGKARDVGCAALVTGWVALFQPAAAWYIYLISFAITLAALTTYYDFINGDDNYYLHGVGIAAGLLPFIIYGVATGTAYINILWFGVRIIALGGFMGLWCKVFSNDYVEEYGRGASIIASLPILLI